MTPSSDDSGIVALPQVGGFRVAVSDEQQAVVVDHEWLAQIAESVLDMEGVTSAEISVALVDDLAIHDVNRQFLEHDYPTDVISFLLNEPGEVASSRHIDGEVVISGETARRCAAEIGCEPTHELALYFIHGLLHLCGYDDHSPADRQQMRRRERSHLQKMGMTPHYDD